MPEMILLLGGARSGKSSTAQEMAHVRGGDQVLFVATAEIYDEEMRDRITRHQNERPSTWQTLEEPLRVAERMAALDLPNVVLLDCMTLLVSNLLLTLPEDCSQEQANATVLREIDALLALQKARSSTWIVVSNEVGLGLVPPYRLGRLYREVLGLANQRLARAADQVLFMVAGLPWTLKPAG